MPESAPTLSTVTFNQTEFYKELSEIEGYLAELRYIDQALEYMDGEEASWWHGLPLFDGLSYVEVQYGTTFPFTKRYQVPEGFAGFPWQESKKTEVQNRLAEIATEATGWAATEIGEVTHRVKPFTWPNASLYESQAFEPVLAAHDHLEDRVGNDFGKLQHSLGNWDGPAADNFASYFYNRFEHTLRSQKQLLLALAGGINAAKAIAESTQHSLMNVVHYLRDALREQLAHRQAQAELERQESQRNILILAGGSATIIGAITGGSLWAVTMATVAGSTAIATTKIPDDAAIEQLLRGSTAEELLVTMTEAIAEIEKNESYQHGELKDVVRKAWERAAWLRRDSDDDDGRLIPISPDIVHGVNGDDFSLP